MNISGLLENLKNNIDAMSMKEIILGGFATALLAMMVVFTILVLISLIIRIINAQPNEKVNESSKNKSVDIVDVLANKAEEDLNDNLEDDDELVAIITASIVAASGKNIVVKRITRTNNNKSSWEKVTNI